MALMVLFDVALEDIEVVQGDSHRGASRPLSRCLVLLAAVEFEDSMMRREVNGVGTIHVTESLTSSLVAVRFP